MVISEFIYSFLIKFIYSLLMKLQGIVLLISMFELNLFCY